MRKVTLTRQKLLLLAGVAAAAGAVVVLANLSVAARPAGNAVAAICKQSTYSLNQPIVIAKVDATASTKNAVLRSQYTGALDAVAAVASAEGAYLVVDTFGSDPAKTNTLCATSTRVAGAAPLFVTARTVELRHVLDDIARKASNVNEGASGSAVYGALVDAVQQVQELRSDRGVPTNIVVITDGDEATTQTHLRLLLDSGATNSKIVTRVVGKLPPPDARGMSIRMEGIGRVGSGPAISTTGARRMVQVWQRICGQTHPAHCSITTDLLTNTSLGR